jgi:hypothetical protein
MLKVILLVCLDGLRYGAVARILEILRHRLFEVTLWALGTAPTDGAMPQIHLAPNRTLYK